LHVSLAARCQPHRGPGGLGVVETARILGLTTAGAPLTVALAAVLVYRILSLGSVVMIG